MPEHLAEDDLLELVEGSRPLGASPSVEAHLADCPACSALLASLLAGPAESVEPSELIGRKLGPYRIDARIGAGAMGVVYRGWDERLGRAVAVKVLSTRFAESASRVRRLEQEGRAAAAISHPNVVTVFDVGNEGGVPFVVSELISGESLRSVIQRRALDRRGALELARDLTRGLAAAHAQGVVHRDLKPENLIVAEDGTLKIVDFGLAKVAGDRAAAAAEQGALLGTSGYLSPEQARGEPADARSDLFAVGAILYELLSDRRAFGGATFAERLAAVLHDDPPQLDDPAWPIVARCLRKDPRLRFQSASDLGWVLEGALGPAPGPQPPVAPRTTSRRAFVLGAAAGGAAAALLSRLLSDRPVAGPDYRQLTFRQGRVASARFTRDGGSVLYSAAWDELPLAVYTTRLGGGGTRALEVPPAQLLAVSSRGELALSLGHRFIEGFHQRGLLALAPLEGGEPRALGVEVQHADFTPDGAELAVVRRGEEQFHLELPIGKVLLRAGWLSCPRVSPDGRQVACLMHDSPGDDRGQVVLVPREGGPPRLVARGFSSVDGLAWTADGRALWISASREGGNNSARALSLDGRERAVMPSVGRVRVFDLSPAGKLAVSHTSGRLRMMVRAPGAEQESDLSLSDVTLVTAMSNDGSQIAFMELGDVDAAFGAFLGPSAGGPALRLGDGMPLDLSRDGRSALAILYGMPAPIELLPIPGGQPRRLQLPGLADVRWARFAAHGRFVVGAAAPERPRRLWRLDSDGALSPLTAEGVFGPAVVSEDGERVALVVRGELQVLNVEDGATRAVPGRFPDHKICRWYAGDRAVLLRTTSAQPVVRKVDLDSGAVEDLFTLDPPRLGRRGVDAVVLSADARAYAYSFGQEHSRLYAATAAAID